MNKPKSVNTFFNVDHEKIDSLIENLNLNYKNEYSNLYNRNIHFKNCDVDFIISRFKLNSKKNLDIIKNNLDDLILKFEEIYGSGVFWNIQIAKLNSNGVILPHVDCGIEFVYSHRIHLPLKTNEKVIFNVDGIDFNFKKGQVVEVNNLKEHSVQNQNSNYDRIHLIFDYMESNYLPFLMEISEKKSKLNFSYT
jgi:hypothetical protein